jgi:uncharacterized membrane protein
MQSYNVYSIVCWIVWLLIFIVRHAFNFHDTNHVILYIFVGWVIGWLGGMIAHKLHR